MELPELPPPLKSNSVEFDRIKILVVEPRQPTETCAQAAREDCDRVLALQKVSYEREIALAVEAERERCAVLCDDLALASEPDDFALDAVFACASAIREGK